MDMELIKGKVVGIILNNIRGLTMAGHDEKVHKSSFFTRVVGFDVFGLWVESRYQGMVSNVYFPWGNIKSIIYFPDKDGIEPSDQDRCLGFRCRTSITKNLPKLRHTGKKKHTPKRSRVKHRKYRKSRKHQRTRSKRR